MIDHQIVERGEGRQEKKQCRTETEVRGPGRQITATLRSASLVGINATMSLCTYVVCQPRILLVRKAVL